jgi:hypothetical protein
MNVVAAARKLETEFGGDGAGAAVGGVAGDADSHLEAGSLEPGARDDHRS